MKKNYINWTKVYILDHQNGLFKVYVSSHTNGYYFGGVLHYVRSGNWSEGSEIKVDMKLEQFMNHSEEGVYQQCTEWVTKNLPGKWTIKLVETI